MEANVIEMCRWYGYDLARRSPTCDKGHRASLKCHSMRKDCVDYLPTSDAAIERDTVDDAARDELRREVG